MNVIFLFLADFPEYIANATLEELPNTLFNSGQVAYKEHHTPCGRRSRHSSNHSTTDVAYYNAVHRNNTVSNGTNPTTDFTHGFDIAMVIPDNDTSHATHFVGSSGGYLNLRTGFENSSDLNTMHATVNTVPYLNDGNSNPPLRPSYASIAQSQPSQKSKQNLVAIATSKSDQVNCDNSVTINRTTSDKKNSKSNNRSGSRLGNVNVNVAEIMQDLERADNKLIEGKPVNTYQVTADGKIASGKSLYSSAVKDSGKSEVPLLSQILQKNSNQTGGNSQLQQNSQGQVMSGQQIGFSKAQVKGQLPGQCLGSQQVKGQTFGKAQSQVKGQLVHSDNNKSDLELEKKGQSQSDNNNQGEDGEVKKKKRRRRRRKKKSGAVTAENDEESTGANEEITLHFEDEEEFPDLAAVASSDPAKSSLFSANTVSYSDVLTNNVSID